MSGPLSGCGLTYLRPESEGGLTGRERVTLAEMRALAHPLRLALLDQLSAEQEDELTRQAGRHHDTQPEPWRAAEAFNSYALRISAAELASLAAAIDRLVRPYIALTRPDAPSDADLARIRLLAFRDPRSS